MILYKYYRFYSIGGGTLAIDIGTAATSSSTKAAAPTTSVGKYFASVAVVNPSASEAMARLAVVSAIRRAVVANNAAYASFVNVIKGRLLFLVLAISFNAVKLIVWIKFERYG